MENDFVRSVSSRATRRNQHQQSKDGGGLLYTEKLSPEYTMKFTWKRGFIRLILTGGIIWMLIILTVLLFHIWSCQSSVAFFSALCNKDSKVYGMLSTMGLVTPPHRCPIPVAGDPNKIVIPKKRSPEKLVRRLSYIMEDSPINDRSQSSPLYRTAINGTQSTPLFGGHQTWKQRDKSFKIKPTMEVHCGFMKGGGEDMSSKDVEYVKKCKFVVATGIFDAYDTPHQPSNISKRSQTLFCFLMVVDEVSLEFIKNNATVREDNVGGEWVGIWRLILLKNQPYDEPRRNGKVPKILTHRLFPQAEYSIWIDGKMELIVDPLLLLERYLWRGKHTFAIAQHKHHRSIYEEADSNKRRKRYARPLIDLHMKIYRYEGMEPWNPQKGTWSDVPEGAIIIREHTALSNLASCLWFNEVHQFTPRDQIIELCGLSGEELKKAQMIIENFANRGLRALGVARQTVPEKTKEGGGGAWEFVGLLPLFDPPRHDSAETIKRALQLGVNVKMITGDQLAIGKETGRRLGMGTNMYPSSSLLGQSHDDSMSVDELIEKADGFAGVFPEHKYEIVKRLQERQHICGMTGDGVNDAPALKKADIGIAVADATDAARGASDIVLTEPGLSVIVSAVLTSRAIFQRMKNYTIYAVSITIRIVLGFMLIALIWKFDFSPFMVLIIALLNDGTIMTISKDRVRPSPVPDSWKLNEIFATGVVLGTYMAAMTVVFFYLAAYTDFFSDTFNVRSIRGSTDELTAALYLQVSIISQALIFVTRSRSWSFVERPGVMLMSAFVIAQLLATVLAVYANWGFARMQAIGWGWAGAIWAYSIVTYFPLDILKFMIRFAFNDDKTATKKNYGDHDKDARTSLTDRLSASDF